MPVVVSHLLVGSQCGLLSRACVADLDPPARQGDEPVGPRGVDGEGGTQYLGNELPAVYAERPEWIVADIEPGSTAQQPDGALIGAQVDIQRAVAVQ